jgi:hypothetical protein
MVKDFIHDANNEAIHVESIYWALADMMPGLYGKLAMDQKASGRMRLTLDISNALLKDLLEDLGVLKLLLDLANDGLGELTLLALLDLALVANPRVKDGLGLGGQSGALLELISLSLKLGGFLQQRISANHSG